MVWCGVVAGLTVGRRTTDRITVLFKVALVLDLSFLYVVHHPNPITVSVLWLVLLCGGVYLAVRLMFSSVLHFLSLRRLYSNLLKLLKVD